jgi:hypothetical protein
MPADVAPPQKLISGVCADRSSSDAEPDREIHRLFPRRFQRRRDRNFTDMHEIMQLRIREARPADRDQLARLREALWTKTSAAEHAHELEPILAGHTSGAMPLVNLVAETR